MKNTIAALANPTAIAVTNDNIRGDTFLVFSTDILLSYKKTQPTARLYLSFLSEMLK
jgi:L-aminopeptidase/D-esterase-like protein